MSESVTSANPDGVFEPFPIDRVPPGEGSKGARVGTAFQVPSASGGGTPITVCIEVPAPRRQANEVHYHMLEEERVLVLEETLTVRHGEAAHVVGPGHCVCFPAGQKVGHALVNHSDAPCR